MKAIATHLAAALLGAGLALVGVGVWKVWNTPLSYRRYQLELHGTAATAAYRWRETRG